ncbi:MAG: hypothetical protein EA349_02035 [Halomonadaceae bacterium]|nr:MAG: hypothetical protein EA349_02035 [Halomonadaceae bacterium]
MKIEKEKTRLAGVCISILSLSSLVMLAGCSGDSSSGNGNGSEDVQTSLNCDQTLQFSPSPSGGVTTTAEYEGARYYASGDSLCRIDPQDNSVTTVDTIAGVDGQLDIALTTFDTGETGNDQVEAIVYANGGQLFSASAGTGNADPGAFSSESEAGEIMQMLPGLSSNGQSTSVAYLRGEEDTQGSWNLADLSDSTGDVPRVLPENRRIVAPVQDSGGELTKWLVVNNPLLSPGEDLTLWSVPVGEENVLSEYNELTTLPDAVIVPFLNSTHIATLDNGNIVFRHITQSSSDYLFYDREGDEISAEVSIPNGGDSVPVGTYATDGEHVYGALVVEDTQSERATLYRISEESDGSLEELSQVAQNGSTNPSFVVASENHVIWAWTDVGGDTFSGVEAVIDPAGASPEITEIVSAEGIDDGLFFSSEVPGYQDDVVFFEGRSPDSFLSRAYWVDLAEYESGPEPDINFHDRALWQGASASSAAEFELGVATNWKVTEVFLSEQDSDNVSHLRVVAADNPENLINLGTLNPTNSLIDPTQLPIPLSVQMQPFGLGPYRLMMIGSDLIMVDTRAEGSLTTLAAEEPDNPVIRRFPGF